MQKIEGTVSLSVNELDNLRTAIRDGEVKLEQHVKIIEDLKSKQKSVLCVGEPRVFIEYHDQHRLQDMIENTLFKAKAYGTRSELSKLLMKDVLSVVRVTTEPGTSQYRNLDDVVAEIRTQEEAKLKKEIAQTKARYDKINQEMENLKAAHRNELETINTHKHKTLEDNVKLYEDSIEALQQEIDHLKKVKSLELLAELRATNEKLQEEITALKFEKSLTWLERLVKLFSKQ